MTNDSGSSNNSPNPELLSTLVANEASGQEQSGPQVQGMAGVPVEPNPAPVVDHSSDPSFFDPPEDSLLGSVLAGRYRIKRIVGEGGMGRVYEAEHIVLEKRVALKVLNPEYATKQDLRERFLQEARAASKINHEHIVDITDFGTTDAGTVFFAMEFLEGHDLGTILSREGALPWERAREIGVQVARALAAAHSKGIIHRDLKPENIFLIEREGRKDFVKVVDFGIAKLIGLDESARKLTKTGMIFGTPDYMSPEQATGRPLDQRADIYSLGVILYEMVAGRVPFDAPSFMAILTKHMFEEPVPPSLAAPEIGIDAAVDALILKALAKEPDERYQSMSEFAEAMKTLNSEPGYQDGPRLQSRDRPILLTSPKALAADTTAPVDAFAPLPHRSSKKGLLIALALLIVAGAVGAVLAYRLASSGTDKGKKQVAQQVPPSNPQNGASSQGRPDAGMAGSSSAGPRADAGVAGTPSRPHPDKVHISVMTRPRGAKVYVQNRYVGKTPLKDVAISYSTEAAVLKIKKRRYRDTEVPFVPNRDRSWVLTLELQRSRHSTSRHQPRPSDNGMTPRPRPRPRPGGDLKDPFGGG